MGASVYLAPALPGRRTERRPTRLTEQRDLTDTKSDRAADSTLVEHPEQVVRRLDGAGFTVQVGADVVLRAESSPSGLEVRETAGDARWTLTRRREGEPSGFVLRAEGAAGQAETMPRVGAARDGEDAGTRFVLLEDGRLFRIVRRRPPDAGFELLGWETPGAYITARCEPEGWRLIPAAACGGLSDIRALTLLLAAEILKAEQPMGHDTP